MIKEIELRIGNWYNYNYSNTPIKLDKDILISLLTNDGLLSLDKLRPIHLTKKILLKCGFEWNGFMYSHSDDMVINDKISFVSIYNDKIQDDVMYDIPESLHELQNLYKFLCKKELHFKP